MNIALKGPEADRALADFRRQIAAWNVALPPDCLVPTGKRQRAGALQDASARSCGSGNDFIETILPLSPSSYELKTFKIMNNFTSLTCRQMLVRSAQAAAALNRAVSQKQIPISNSCRRKMRMVDRITLMAALIAAILFPRAGLAQETNTEYLSDVLLGISSYTIDYTKMLGLDTTSYPLWPVVIPGEPIRIKGQTYAKGIGAPYSGITIMLDGRYAAFEAEAGVQTGSTGAGYFTVTVDGKQLFNSGTMTEKDEAKKVKVVLTGAQEMILLASSTAKVNWADAKLIRAASVAPADPVEMAPFARVVTFDPARTDGVRVDRLTEFPAEDVFLETELAPESDGTYTVPAGASGERCIGLQWTEQRRLRRLGLEFAAGVPQPPFFVPTLPSPEGVRVEGWIKESPMVMGHSPWQGKWTPLKGKIEVQGEKWTFALAGKDNRDVAQGTYKIRWIFPATGQPIKVRRLSALTSSIWQTAELRIEAEKGAGQRGEIEVYNGELLGPVDGKDPLRRTWAMGEPLKLKVRYTKPRPWGFDRTVLRLTLPNGSFGVAVDDALSTDCLYIKDMGVFVAKEPAKIGLEQYKASIAGRKGILEQVRQRPDQEFKQALNALYIPDQDRSPTLLSLGWDNRKVIVQRTGEIGWGPTYLDFVQQRSSHRIIPRFGSGANHQFPDSGLGTNASYKRELEGGWLPLPKITVKDGGLQYQEVTFVAPFDDEKTSQSGPWLYKRPVCVGEYAIENPQAAPAQATLKLAFVADAQVTNKTAQVEVQEDRVVVISNGQLLAVVETAGIAPLKVEVTGTTLTLSGELAAGAKARCYAYMPLWELKPAEQGKLTGGAGLRQRAEAYWKQVMDQAMQIEIPDPLLRNIIYGSQIHCILASREEEGKNIEPWISSTYYCSLDTESHDIIQGMDQMGQFDYARRGLDFFIKREKPEGYFTHGYSLMATGQHLWFLSDYYRLTGDRDWWIKLAPKVAKMCHWVVRQSAKTKRLDARGQKIPGTA